ncbi:MAG: MMPL family transporter [Deltaproteobacteria bacterium]|nr:MMPL family transporter [Deltaproteobacteria bacterium]
MPDAPRNASPNWLTARIEGCLFGRRVLVLAAFALVTIVMGWYAAQLRVDAGFFKLVPLKHEYMQTFLKHQDEFGGADRVVIAITAREGDMFTPEFFTVLKQVTDAMFFLPGIDRTQVSSILTPNVRYIEVVEDGVVAGNVLPANFRPTPEGLARVRENAIKAGIVGRLVANDFTGAIVSGRLQEFHPNTGERLDYIEVARQLEQIRAKALAGADVDVHVHVIGFAKLVGDIAAGAARVIVFFGITFLITALFVFLYTRSVRLTIPPLVCSLVAVVWQLGTVTALGFGIDPMSILVPFLVFAVGVSHGVQMVSAVRAEVVAGAASLDAARASFRRLLLPGAVALASDSVGFITISLIDVQVIRETAITASLGIVAIILTNLGLLPVLLSYFRMSDAQRRAAAERDSVLRPLWSRVARLARRGPAAVTVALAAVLVAVGAHYAVQVRVGDSHAGVPELRAESVYNQDIAVITERFKIGVDVLTVFAETVPDGCIDYEVLTTLDEFAWHVRNVDGVQSVLSLAGVARNINAGWNEGNLKWRTLPRNRYSLVQSVSPVPTSSGLINNDCSVLPVLIYTTDHKAETIQRVVDATKDFQRRNTLDRINFRLAGGNVGVMAATNEEVDASQFPILGYVFAGVILLCLISFRSVTATVCIIVPLAAVSLLAYGLMAILEIGLKISTLPVVALGVGIGVDYAIYIYGRLRTHLDQGLDFATAYERTLNVTGAGVVLTGLTLAAGVATWILAPLKFQADMGTVLMFMFLVNMIAAVLLLPALGAWLVRPKTARPGSES